MNPRGVRHLAGRYKTVPEKDQKELLNEFEKVLKAAPPIQYPSNIALVRKYYDKIDMALQ